MAGWVSDPEMSRWAGRVINRVPVADRMRVRDEMISATTVDDVPAATLDLLVAIEPLP